MGNCGNPKNNKLKLAHFFQKKRPRSGLCWHLLQRDQYECRERLLKVPHPFAKGLLSTLLMASQADSQKDQSFGRSVELSWKDARPELSNTAVAAEPMAFTTSAPCMRFNSQGIPTCWPVVCRAVLILFYLQLFLLLLLLFFVLIFAVSSSYSWSFAFFLFLQLFYITCPVFCFFVFCGSPSCIFLLLSFGLLRSSTSSWLCLTFFFSCFPCYYLQILLLVFLQAWRFRKINDNLPLNCSAVEFEGSTHRKAAVASVQLFEPVLVFWQFCERATKLQHSYNLDCYEPKSLHWHYAIPCPRCNRLQGDDPRMSVTLSAKKLHTRHRYAFLCAVWTQRGRKGLRVRPCV